MPVRSSTHRRTCIPANAQEFLDYCCLFIEEMLLTSPERLPVAPVTRATFLSPPMLMFARSSRRASMTTQTLVRYYQDMQVAEGECLGSNSHGTHRYTPMSKVLPGSMQPDLA